MSNHDERADFLGRLRDPNAKQARYALRVLSDPDAPGDEGLIGNCCLGVAAQCLVDRGIGHWGAPRPLGGDATYHYHYEGYEGEVYQQPYVAPDGSSWNSELPPDLWTRFKAPAGTGPAFEPSQSTLWVTNDGGYSFAEIADYLETGAAPRSKDF